MMMTIHVRQWAISSGRLRLLLLAGWRQILPDRHAPIWISTLLLPEILLDIAFCFGCRQREKPETETKQPMLGVFSVQLRAPRDVVLRIIHIVEYSGFLCTECLKGFINEEARNPKGNQVIYQGVLLQSKLRTYNILQWMLRAASAIVIWMLNGSMTTKTRIRKRVMYQTRNMYNIMYIHISGPFLVVRESETMSFMYLIVFE